MCGIAGIYNYNQSRPIDANSLRKMTGVLYHRGPDDEGHFIDNNVGLGFRRLSIIDLKSGHQPLCDNSKRYWITFNGEIYNFQELRKNLQHKGYDFKTNTDTEVIVNLYAEYREECLQYLRGMFAFVIWDKKEKTLFGARDRMGIKPFYYYSDNEKFVWASEIKSILTNEDIEIHINPFAIDQYLTYGYILRNFSIYKEIKKLEPGSFFLIKPNEMGQINTKRYWTLSFQPDFSKAYTQWKEELREELAQSVKMRMISDVPLGAFLSGGIDSSSVVALMGLQSSQPVKTFSIGFKEQSYNELQYARVVANKYNTEHHELIIEPESIDLLPKLVNAYDEPFSDSSAIPTYYVSKFAKENVTVALSGDGGDELFAGYKSYKKMLQLHQRPFNNRIINNAVYGFHKVLPDYVELKKWTYYFKVNSNEIGALLGIFKPYERSLLYKAGFKSIIGDYESEIEKIKLLGSNEGDFISKMQLLDINTYLVDDILTKVDRASMMNSLEVRVPILDHKVVELASRIPSQFKINDSGQKLILKDALKDLLPKEIVNHKKQGFAVPLSMWFKDDLKEYLVDNLLSSSAMIYTFFERNAVEKMVNNHNRGFRDYSFKIWTLLFFEIWLQNNNKIVDYQQH